MTDLVQGSDAWLEARRGGIGGSEAGTLYGVGFLTQWMLWAKKTGRETEKRSDLTPGKDQRMYWGNAHEREIRVGYQLLTGRTVTDGVTMLRHPTIEIMMANTDGAVAEVEGYEGLGVWEAKTAAGFLKKDWFDEDGQPSAPLGYQVQAQHYMACTGLKWASFAVLFGGNDLRWFDFHRNDDFIDGLEQRIVAWWDRHVVNDEPPPIDDSKKTEAAMRLIFGNDDGSVVRLPDGFKFLREWWDLLDVQRKGCEVETQRLKNLVLSTMGKAAVGVTFDGRGFTCKTNKAGERKLARVEEGTIKRATKGLPALPTAVVMPDVAQALEIIEAMATGRNISPPRGVG